MKKILTVFGTRPEAIKMAPLIREFQNQNNKYSVTVCVTGQHREMLDQVLQLFNIIPEYDLNIMKSGQDLYDVTTKILTGLRPVLQKTQPDLVLVHGDTTTSMAAALASFYQQIPIGHIEAGLRTGNLYNPWPEEVNRQITARLASWHFAPTIQAKKNLICENISSEQIFVTGNTVIDALLWVVNKIKENNTLRQRLTTIFSSFNISPNKILSWKEQKRRLILITGHRRENFGDGFVHICKAIKYLGEQFPEVDFVYPVHLNPNVRKPVNEILGTNNSNENIYLIPPLEYLPFIYLMNISYFILTDSGGIQEEAPGLGKPVLVMRETTERPEAVEAGTVKLIGTNTEQIISYVSSLLKDNDLYTKMSKAINPYGNGCACKNIIGYLDEIMFSKKNS